MSATIQAKALRLQALHQAPNAFVIPNAWDAGSARILAGLGFGALATSRGAVPLPRHRGGGGGRAGLAICLPTDSAGRELLTRLQVDEKAGAHVMFARLGGGAQGVPHFVPAGQLHGEYLTQWQTGKNDEGQVNGFAPQPL